MYFFAAVVFSSNGTAVAPIISTSKMMSISFYRLASFVVSTSPFLVLTAPSGDTKAEVALNTLQTWYNTSSGIYDTTGWWNSANCLTALGDLAAIDITVVPTALEVFSNSLVQARKDNQLLILPNSSSACFHESQSPKGEKWNQDQKENANSNVNAEKYNLQMQKVVTEDYNIISFYGPLFPTNFPPPPILNPKGFLNGYYDDEGWWALAWIQAYDVTKNPLYLQTAINIFNDMKNGATTPCGGIWWDKEKTYVNAIANELFLSVAAHLANRAFINRDLYLETAKQQWEWFQHSGMINSQNLVNDGLDNKTCHNNNGTVWSYNQGVALGGLTELFYATKDQSYLKTATTIANAAIIALQDKNKVLHDSCEPNCGADGSQFKGVFLRNLQVLQEAAPSQTYVDFAAANAASIWAYNRVASDGTLSVVWSGPYVNPANASTQSSALDALIADQAFGDYRDIIVSRKEML